MQTSSANDDGVQVADYGRLLRRQAWLILVVTLTGGLLAAAYTATQAKIFEARSAVLVRPILLNPAEAVKRTEDLVNLDTESQLVRSVPVVTAAKTALKSSKSVEELSDAVRVTVPANTQVMQITYAGSSAVEAQQGAQAFTTAYLGYRSDQAKGDAKRQLDQLNKQALTITSQLLDVSGKIAGAATNSPDRAYLASQQQTLTSQLTDTRTAISRLTNLDIVPGSRVQSPELPKKATSPSLPLNTAIGLALGALLGLFLGMLRYRRDDRVRTADDLERALGLPVLATIPTSRLGGRQLATLSSGPSLEGYRRLRSVLLGVLADDARRRAESIGAGMLPSARDGERSAPAGRVVLITKVGTDRKTDEVGANLAVLLTRSGSSVVLIDTRIDSPTSAAFGLANDRGLSDVVTHEAYGEELVQRPAGMPTLAVIGSGHGSTPVGEVMSTRVGRSLLDWLRRTADYVIITTASVTSSADAQALAPLAHAVILTVPAGGASEPDIRAASHELAQVGAPFTGAVLLVRSGRGGGAPIASTHEEAAALAASTQS